MKFENPFNPDDILEGQVISHEGPKLVVQITSQSHNNEVTGIWASDIRADSIDAAIEAQTYAACSCTARIGHKVDCKSWEVLSS